MSEIRQGQVYWLDFVPATGSSPAKQHLCVVVQNDIFSRSAHCNERRVPDYVGPERTSAPGNVLLKKGEAKLPKASVLNVSQILPMDKAELLECTGQLSGAANGAVRDGLHFLFGKL